MAGYNSLVGEPFPEYDDPSGMLNLVSDESADYNAYPTAAADGTQFTVAAILLVSAALLLGLRLAGFRGMVAIDAGR